MISLTYNNQNGASAVEFAIMLPVLAALLFGIIDFSLLFYNKQVLTNASRELARFAIVEENRESGTLDAQKDKIYEFCSNHLISLAGSTEPVEVDPEIDNNFVTVTIRYPYTYFFGSLLGFDSTELAGRTVMRKEL